MRNILYISGLFQDTFEVPAHKHQNYELIYYTKGTGTVTIESQDRIPFSPGTLLLVEPGLSHSDVSPQGFQNMHLHLVHPKLPLERYLLIHDNENQDILHIFQSIHYEYHRKQYNHPELMNALYQVLYQYMISLMTVPPRNTYINRLIRDIIQNISNPFYSVQDSICSMPFHPNYFRSLFRNQTGCSPVEYLTRKRMEYARELISTKAISGYSFGEIARLCGYEDEAYFSRLFKKHTGCSPRNWMIKEGEKA